MNTQAGGSSTTRQRIRSAVRDGGKQKYGKIRPRHVLVVPVIEAPSLEAGFRLSVVADDNLTGMVRADACKILAGARFAHHDVLAPALLQPSETVEQAVGGDPRAFTVSAIPLFACSPE